MDQRLERHTRECSQEPMHAQAGTGAQTCDIFAVCGCSRKPIYRHMYTHTDTHILYIYYIILYYIILYYIILYYIILYYIILYYIILYYIILYYIILYYIIYTYIQFFLQAEKQKDEHTGNA